MTIRLPKLAPGDVVEFDGTRGERAANILSHAWEQEANPTTEQIWLIFYKRPRPEFLSRCSRCNAVKDLSKCADWPCGNPRLAETYIW
jgi:hypothetical protein